VISVMLEMEFFPRSKIEQTENEPGRTKFSYGGTGAPAGEYR